jgi:hypothetical protein
MDAAPAQTPVRSESSLRSYQRRRPEETVLYRVVHQHLEAFLEDGRRRSEHGFGYPAHIEKTFRRFLACGRLEEGFARLRCKSCGSEHLVAFLCKGRGVCPSCQGRRMVETAARLVDTLLPVARYRQVVFTFPFPLRLRMAQEPKAVSAVLRCCTRALFAQLRRRGRKLGIRNGRPAALTAVQVFGSALNLNVHFHLVTLDGLFVVDDNGSLRIEHLPPPTDADVQALLGAVQRRVERLLTRGQLATDDVAVEDEPSPLQLAIFEAARTPRSRDDEDSSAPEHKPPYAFSCHAGTCVRQARAFRSTPQAPPPRDIASASSGCSGTSSDPHSPRTGFR